MGVRTLGDPLIYTRPLEHLGTACETADAGQRSALDGAIFRVMEGRAVAGVVLGCTEIPLLLGESADAADLINPAQLLAEAAVRAAMT